MVMLESQIYVASIVGLGSLGETCSPRGASFMDSNPAEGHEFLGRKNPEQKSFGREL